MNDLSISAVEQALISQTQQLTDISQNLSKVSTPAAKEERSFIAYIDGEAKPMSYQVYKQGALKPTGEQTDIAINGKGGFWVEDNNGNTELVRSLKLTLKDGYLANNAGRYILTEQGRLIAPSSQLEITASGEIHYQQQPLGHLLMSNEGDDVMQGFKEQSAVDPAQQMIELIKLSRSLESYKTVIQSKSQMNSSAFEQLGGL